MDRATSWVVGVIVVLVVLVGAWYFFGSSAGFPSINLQGQEATSTPTGSGSGSGTSASGATKKPTTGVGTTPTTVAPLTVQYTDGGFSPLRLTVKKGQSVTFVNNSTHPMWVASDAHPSHTSYDGTSRSTHCAAGYKGAIPFDECSSVSAGGTYSFTFTKVGTFTYHNHAFAEDVGTITVTQ